jgi:hypothetical protein
MSEIGDKNRAQMLARVATSLRAQRGWGPSEFASQEETDAWRALRVGRAISEGTATVADLPESYGGMPTGTTRRAIRQREAWQQEQQFRSQIEEQERKREADILEMESKRADSFIRQQEFNDKQEREYAIKRDGMAMMNSMRGVTLPNGMQLRPINPADPDAISRLEDIAVVARYGLEDPLVKAVWERKYADAQKFAEKNLIASDKIAQEQAKAREDEAKARVAIAKELGAYGMSIVDFTKDGRVDFEAANAAIGKAWAEGKEVPAEKAQTEEQRKAIYSRITDAEKKILDVRARAAAAQRRVEARPTVKDFKTELEAAQIEQGILEDEVNRLNRMLGGEKQPAAAQPQTTGQRPALGDIFGGQ